MDRNGNEQQCRIQVAVEPHHYRDLLHDENEYVRLRVCDDAEHQPISATAPPARLRCLLAVASSSPEDALHEVLAVFPIGHATDEG